MTSAFAIGPIRAALLVGLLAGSTAGCLAEPREEPLVSDALPHSRSLRQKPDVQGLLPEALFIVQPTDLYAPDWPGRFAGYRLLVCNPSIPPEDVEIIHRDLPGVVALAYVNLQDLAFDQYPDNPYWQAFAAVFDTSWCVRDLPTHRVIRVWGYNGTPGSGLMHAIPHARDIDTLVSFYRDATMAAGWDGLYLDQCHRDYPPWQKAAVLAQSSDFDADGDGVQDTLDDLARKWVVGRVMMTSRLRSALGGSAILLANSGGPLVDASLNGITIEGVGSQWTVVQARSFLQAERAVARTPFFGAGWVLTEECDAPTRNLARLVPGCFYGRMTGEYP